MILSKVRVKNIKTNKELTYTIVSEKEADLKSNKLSVSSPIGKGLIGKAVGDVAEISAPAGVVQMEILEISR
jgi:transcription elongation factor GreA